MAISLFIHPKIQFLTDAGAPLNGGKVYFYIPGTTTDKDTYTDQGGTVANANPVILDAYGRAEIWLGDDEFYDVVLKTSADVTVWSIDNISNSGALSTTSTDEWNSPGDTPTYIGATQFSVTGDKRTTYQVGRRVKITETAGTVYGVISVVAYTSLTTVTVVLDSGTVDSGISNVDVGLLTVTNPSMPKTTYTILDATALNHAVAAQQVNSGELVYVAETGAQDVYVLTLVPAITAYTEGMRVRCKLGAYTNSSTTPTLNVNGLGAKTITRVNGGALLVGDLISGWRAEFEYTGTTFHLLNPAQGNEPRYALDTGAADAYAIAPLPTIVSYKTGQKFLFKVVNANVTTTPTLNVTALGTKTIKKGPAGDALLAGDMPAGLYAECVYDGTDMILQNPFIQVGNQNQLIEVELTANVASADTYEDIALWKLYIPAEMTTLEYGARIKGVGGWRPTFRMYSTTTDGAELTTISTSYEWQTEDVLDVSDLSGWVVITLEVKCNSNSNAYFIDHLHTRLY